MGKRKQGSRATKRAAETYKEFEQTLTEQAEQDRVSSKPDDELFVIDTERKEASAKNKLVKREKYREKVLNRTDKKTKGKYEPSDKDLRQIHKVLENHGELGAVTLAKRGRAKLDQKRQMRRMAGMAKAGKPTYDIWDEPSQPNKKAKLVAVTTGRVAQGGTAPVEIVSVQKNLPNTSGDTDFEVTPLSGQVLSKKQHKARKHAQLIAKPSLALEIAHPGQSYRPDKEQHQDAIGEALSIEIRRNEAEEYKKAPISNGMSAFTQGYIIRESDSDESSDEEDDDDIAGSAKLIKKKDKLTRAQRNKQKRVKAEQTALLERKQQKQFMHQINEVKKHDKALKEADKKATEKQKELSQLKEEKQSKPLGRDLWNAVSQKDPIRAPSLPVALTEELEGKSNGGSLRTVTPKGSLVTDRLESMVARGMISKKKVDGRRIVQGKRRKKVVGEKGTEYLLI